MELATYQEKAGKKKKKNIHMYDVTSSICKCCERTMKQGGDKLRIENTSSRGGGEGGERLLLKIE